MTATVLKKLHTAMIDTREGYKVAEREAATPELKALFAKMIALRTKDHEAIHSVLSGMGEQPDDAGSFMATVHTSVTGIVAVVTGLDACALSPFISGEKKILDNYDAAIDEADLSAATRDMLIEQQTELLEKVAEMEAMEKA